MMELLSIIVPVYNGEKHIDECIKSLNWFSEICGSD